MALRVWLPLDGTLENKGVSNYNIVKADAVTFSANGKIGQCATAASSANITLTMPELSTFFGDNKTYSLACWVKVVGTATSGWFIKFGSNSCGLWWAKSAPRWVWNENDNGKRCANETISNDTTNWHHLTITVDKTISGKITTKQYVDGALAASYPGSTFDNPSTKPTGTTITINPYIASVNDVRIYDHCLSAAEVKEISQGLVLHYKLDHVVQPNLLNGNINTIDVWIADGCTRTQDGDAIKIVNNNSGGKRIYNNVSNVWTPVSSHFIVSFEAKAATDGVSIDCNRSNNNGTDKALFTLTTNWAHYSGQIINTAAATGGTLSIRCNTNGATFWIKNIKLERGDIETRFVMPGETDTSITDSSGYEHSGTIVGTPTLISDTPRYSASTAFNGTTDAINCGRTFEIQQAQAMTFCAWIYSDNWNNSTNKYYLSSQESGGFVLRSLDNNKLRARIHAYTASDLSTTSYIDADYDQSSANIGASGWHHVAGVYTTSNLKLYIDGILRKTTSATTYGAHFNSSAYLFLGAECAGRSPSTFCNCKLSDVRIYYTALSDADILSLYNTAAKVDNLHNMHTFEYIEGSSNIKLTKQGQFKEGEIQEDITTKFYKTNNTIKAKNFIEF